MTLLLTYHLPQPLTTALCSSRNPTASLLVLTGSDPQVEEELPVALNYKQDREDAGAGSDPDLPNPQAPGFHSLPRDRFPLSAAGRNPPRPGDIDNEMHVGCGFGLTQPGGQEGRQSFLESSAVSSWCRVQTPEETLSRNGWKRALRRPVTTTLPASLFPDACNSTIYDLSVWPVLCFSGWTGAPRVRHACGFSTLWDTAL